MILVLLLLTTTRRPATDLGRLLALESGEVHEFAVPGGIATLHLPEVSAHRCTAAVFLEWHHRGSDLGDDQAGAGGRAPVPAHVTSDMLADAVSLVFRNALAGASGHRYPHLLRAALPLEIVIPQFPCQAGVHLAERLFGPLGWRVLVDPVLLDARHPEWGDTGHSALTLRGTISLADAVTHLSVLLPVLVNGNKGRLAPEGRIGRLLRPYCDWLTRHPERQLIMGSYQKRRGASLVRTTDASPKAVEMAHAVRPTVVREGLAVERLEAVLAALARTSAERVIDLGCGTGVLLARIAQDSRYTEVVGVDDAAQALELARRRLQLELLPERQRSRIKLLQLSILRRDNRLIGFDAAILMEVIEHFDPFRLPALVINIFGHARPGTVIVTTPNLEHTLRYPGPTRSGLRHDDHRFEWSRQEFAAWVADASQRYGYVGRIQGVGTCDPQVGHPTQLAVFTRLDRIASSPKPRDIRSRGRRPQ